MTTAPTNPNSAKIASLQARMTLAEAQIQALILQTKKLAKLDDQPPSIEGQWAINRILDIAISMSAFLQNNQSIDPVLKQDASEAMSLLIALGRTE